MQSFEILDIKAFMLLLFQSTVLDKYEFVSGDLHTDMTYSLDGHINREFFSADEIEQLELNSKTYLPWHLAKEKIFALIKGKKTPSQLKIVLKVSADEMADFVAQTDSALNLHDIDAMYLNIHFQNNKLHIICGISYKLFTMDKTLENGFTDNIITLFKSNSITCEI